MTDAAPTEPTSEIIEEAALWAVQLNAPDATDADRQACENWCLASPAHQLAMDRMRALDMRIGNTGHVERHGLQTLWLNRRRKGQWSGGISILLLLGVTAVTSAWIAENRGRAHPEYETAIGEQRTFKLEDGSTLTLDTDSAASVSLSGGERKITLQRGQVLAQVAHGSVPFVVSTPFGSATALGTAYAVGLDAAGATVTVTRSRVRACDTGKAGAIRCMTLGPGRRALLDARGVTALADVDPESASGWAEGWLAVDDQPVAEVLAELNRYRAKAILFRPAQISDIRVSGSFPLGNTDRALEAVVDASGLRISRASDGTAMVEPK